MADVGAWTAAATACAAAIGTVIAAARQPADVATLRAEVKSAKDDAPAAVKVAVDAVRAALDDTIAKVRVDLVSVAHRVGALEEWRKRAHAQNEGRATVISGNDLSAATDREHERRIAALEAKTERMDTALNEARISLGNVLGQLGAFIRGRS